MLWFCLGMMLFGTAMTLLNYPKTEKEDRSCFYYWSTHVSIWAATIVIIWEIK